MAGGEVALGERKPGEVEVFERCRMNGTIQLDAASVRQCARNSGRWNIATPGQLAGKGRFGLISASPIGSSCLRPSRAPLALGLR
jgi:hypothetical protein